MPEWNAEGDDEAFACVNTPSSDPSELRVVVNCTGARVRSVPGVSVLNRGIMISPPPASADDDDDDDDAIANDDEYSDYC